tara:strand:+ start:1445 stop:1597 length:153 start_codon:yes stop_codon:yes gene_type:complete
MGCYSNTVKEQALPEQFPVCTCFFACEPLMKFEEPLVSFLDDVANACDSA